MAACVAGALLLGPVATACSSSSSPTPTQASTVGASTEAAKGADATVGASTVGASTAETGAATGAGTTATAETGPATVGGSPAQVEGDASQEISVVFDTPGADPRPLKETAVAIDAPTPVLRMRVTDLTYRGVVCGFTFTGTRPASPVTIRVAGTTAAGGFTSGPVGLRWADDGTTSADSPSSDNGWSFSADSYPSRNGRGWAVSIGAVTAEGENVNPTGATCELRSGVEFVAENGPVGYWAGFATR